MLFNSYLFLFVFLPVALLGFFMCSKFLGRKAALLWLITCSFYFYILWDPAYWWVITSTIIINYIIGVNILSRKAAINKRLLLWSGVISNIVFLAWFKIHISPLFQFLPGNAGDHTTTFSNTNEILIPLAISFITFQQIVFLVDCYKNRCVSSEFIDYVLFISFFPQLVMGPIVHQREITPQFRDSNTYRFNTENFTVGLSIFVIGLFKKTVLADGIAVTVNQVYATASMGGQVSLIDSWVAATGFIFQLYFDFSGYADMAIGIAKMLNINLPINFDSPLTARNRFEHWRRWHITFSEFMKNHVYMPLVRNKRIPLGKYSALMVTTFLSGLWHGIGMSFILWGVIQGGMMVISHLIKKRFKGYWLSFLFTRPVSIMITFMATVLISILFRSGDLSTALVVYKGIFGLNGVLIPQPIELILNAISSDLAGSITALTGIKMGAITTRFGDMYYMAIFFIIVFLMPTTREYFRKYWTALDQRNNAVVFSKTGIASKLCFDLDYKSALVITVMLYLSLYTMLTETSRFIYFQF